MGTMTFQIPAGLPREAVRELERTCLAGGPDNMPYPAQLQIRGDTLTLTRNVDDSGYLVAPWNVEGFGQLMGASATLTERPVAVQRPRRTGARQGQPGPQPGLRLADRRTADHPRPASADSRRDLHLRSRRLQHRPARSPGAGPARLVLGYQAASTLVQAYLNQVFQIRHQRLHDGRLESALSTRLTPAGIEPPLAPLLLDAFNRASVPLGWHTVEGEETVYRWDQADRLLAWAENNELEVTAGPLIDFSSAQLPAWLWLWERDVPSIATFMCRFVEAAVRRYRTRIRRWQLTAASNWANVLSLTEDELMGLTFRLGEAARQVDPSLELVVGVSQPWGEYMAKADRTYSPFIFADNLIRSGLNLSALDIEMVMGVNGRGSYCRDLLEMSRLLDLYALLGVPLQVTLGYPAGVQTDREADPELSVAAGTWQTGCTPEAQAEWAGLFGSLALCKPYIQSVAWTHFTDHEPHVFPECGLIDLQGRPRPALNVLRSLRHQHLA